MPAKVLTEVEPALNRLRKADVIARKDVADDGRGRAYAKGEDLDASRAFYTDVLGFEVAMEAPVLGRTSPSNRGAQVLIPPTGFDDPQPQFGIDLGDPEAVDAAGTAAVRRGLRVVYALRDEPWGVRRFFVEESGGTIVNVLSHTAARVAVIRSGVEQRLGGLAGLLGGLR